MNAPEVRERLVDALRLDLIGPEPGSEFERELLRETPDVWYLTGFLAPSGSKLEDRVDPGAQEDLFQTAEGGGLDDDDQPEKPPAKTPILPSSMGLSFFVPPGVGELEVEVAWGDYKPEPIETEGESQEPKAREEPGSGELLVGCEDPKVAFRRVPCKETIRLALPRDSGLIRTSDVPGSDGLVVEGLLRKVTDHDLAQELQGARPVVLFLVNKRRPRRNVPGKHYKYEGYAFQAKLTARCPEGFAGVCDLKRRRAGDWEGAVADLHFRDVREFAVGHGVSAKATVDHGACKEVATEWAPVGEVERVAPAVLEGVELGMERLGAIALADEAIERLKPFVKQYRDWISEQGAAAVRELAGSRLTTSEGLLKLAVRAADRIEAGIECLRDEDVFEAFQISNRAVALAARRRVWFTAGRKGSPADLPAPEWRPFQLAFILMNLPGLVDGRHPDREVVDLLFFPTGGGKTEAYLGLAAFAMTYRRFLNPGERGCGVSVLMRYTLRLLTLDQLGRAAGLVCALELERERNPRLGEWPFEIGLWVGRAATPNRLGKVGDRDENCAYRKLYRFRNHPRDEPAPIPLEECPWCGTKFGVNSFRMIPHERDPLDLRIGCVDEDCSFNGTGNRFLPIVGVDEPIYRRLPAFIIATVDKFAALPWTGSTGKLFGQVTSFDKHGFYGPCDPHAGAPMAEALPPPDLIVQDELHLISGPLGTVAGLYETTIDALCSRADGDGKRVRPKVVASTATVKRAESQIRALFARPETAIFPPPGPDRRDSFFAVTKLASEEPARLYVGLAAQGRSPKLLLLRAGLALLSRAKTLYEQEGVKRDGSADPYMTLLAYFNSLRELGGARRIVEDEVRGRLEDYENRQRLDPRDGLFINRTIAYDVMELTSRVSTAKVAEAKRGLAQPFGARGSVDVALATNMISVGLDIVRLGLMVVFGQPKTTAEYIQATSRVGRDPQRPGLVVTLFNVNKPRDRSHYERFSAYHSAFYREVEATSVTPFAPRALDRALPAALVALGRHSDPAMTGAFGAHMIIPERTKLQSVAVRFSDRARDHRRQDGTETERLEENVRRRSDWLLDSWFNIAETLRDQGTRLEYSEAETEGGGATPLLHDFLDPELAILPEPRRRFRAARSMREVEATVELRVERLPTPAGRS